MRFLLSAAIVASGCQCSEPLLLLPGYVEGEVCDPATGAPLAGLRARIGRREARTDDLGRYALARIPAGPQVVVVGEGSGAAVRRFPVEVSETEGVFVVDTACRTPPGAPRDPPPEDPADEAPPSGPPAIDPPADDPPVDDPPVDSPPADDPPADDPPAEPPPAQTGVDVVELPLFFFGDCIVVSCPGDHPYPVGCAVFFTPGDARGCVANTPGASDVYFQAGDECNAGFVTGTLRCGVTPAVLDRNNCPINKPVQFHVATPNQCPAVHD